MRRLPIRWRVTLAFSLTLLVVLSVVGVVVHSRFAAELDGTLDRGLRARSSELAALVARSPAGLAETGPSEFEDDESVAQVLRQDGTVVAATAGASRPLIDAGQLRRGRSETFLADRRGDAALDESLRLLVAPVEARGERLVVVVGASRDENAEALSSLLLLGSLGLAAALVVAGVAGHVVGGIALRPVEAMRARAAEIADRPDRRLPVPPVDDELGRLANTLNAMLERLERAQEAEREAIAAERRFVADASHELRTPLTILRSEIEVALLGNRSPAELEAALASAGEETERLCRLAEDLLALARSDEGGLPIRPQRIDVGDLVRSVAARERRRAEAAGRALSVTAAPGLWITGDPLHLGRAVGDLVDNALRHGSGAIELSAGREQANVWIAVRDHGNGFGDGFRAHAFERFSRADPGRGGPGTGLGLALVDAVARAHGGTAAAQDADPGARVRIVLPAG